MVIFLARSLLTAGLRQIIINLISNATKFTEHGRITLSVQAGAPQAPLGGGA
ncbi:MAG: hypothetical protein R3F31_08665 [Verrucomicrobiales bacterium]